MLREDRFKMLMTRAFEVRPETGSSRSCRPTTQPSRRFPRCQRALQPAAMLAVEPAVGPAIGPAIKPAVQSVVTTSKKEVKMNCYRFVADLFCKSQQSSDTSRHISSVCSFFQLHL